MKGCKVLLLCEREVLLRLEAAETKNKEFLAVFLTLMSLSGWGYHFPLVIILEDQGPWWERIGHLFLQNLITYGDGWEDGRSGVENFAWERRKVRLS